jgi:superfamily II DNA/RNA helicase
LITIREDLDAITSILYQGFEIPSFKRDYDAAFGKIADILSRYGIIKNPRNLRFRFTCTTTTNFRGIKVVTLFRELNETQRKERFKEFEQAIHAVMIAIDGISEGIEFTIHSLTNNSL